MPIPAPARTRPLRFAYEEPSRSLLIEWADATTHGCPRRSAPRLPLRHLRRGDGLPRGASPPTPTSEPGEDELADIALVGAYGLNAVWADGHSTGIYSFERLRELGERTGVASTSWGDGGSSLTSAASSEPPPPEAGQVARPAVYSNAVRE